MTEADLENLSPFTLLGDSGEGVEQDVAQVVAKVRQDVRAFGPKDCHQWAHPGPEGRGQIGSGIPTEAALLAAVSSPNPWVRDAARRIVEAGGADVYPAAMLRLPPK